MGPFCVESYSRNRVFGGPKTDHFRKWSKTDRFWTLFKLNTTPETEFLMVPKRTISKSDQKRTVFGPFSSWILLPKPSFWWSQNLRFLDSSIFCWRLPYFLSYFRTHTFFDPASTSHHALSTPFYTIGPCGTIISVKFWCEFGPGELVARVRFSAYSLFSKRLYGLSKIGKVRKSENLFADIFKGNSHLILKTNLPLVMCSHLILTWDKLIEYIITCSHVSSTRVLSMFGLESVSLTLKTACTEWSQFWIFWKHGYVFRFGNASFQIAEVLGEDERNLLRQNWCFLGKMCLGEN